MSENPTEIALGDRTYQLAPQRIGRIGRKLSAVMDLFAGVGGGQMPTDAAPLYDALKVFIPDIDPIWKLSGYASEEAFKARERFDDELRQARDLYAKQLRLPDTVEAGLSPEIDTTATWVDLTPEEQAEFEPPTFEDPYDEAADKSPTPPQIMDAIESIFALHGGQRLVRLLKNFVTPEMIRGQILRMQVEAASARSRSLRRENGASGQTPSTTPEPTSETQTTDSLASLQPGS
jgi:hypothetical protein